jgi:hypothetical protein
MKQGILFLCALIAIVFQAENVQAGFVSKKQHAAVHSTGSWASEQSKVAMAAEMRLAKMLSGDRIEHGDVHHDEPKHSASGWEGTASFWCGIGGLILFPPALICAVIFGALGRGVGHHKRGRAIAGLIIGISGIFMYALILLFA